MATTAATLFVRLIADTQNFSSGMKSASDQATVTRKNLERTANQASSVGTSVSQAGTKASSGLKTAASGSAQFSGHMRTAGNAADAAGGNLRKLEGEARDLDKKISSVSGTGFEREMDKAGDAAKRAEARVKSAQDGFGKFKSSMGQAGKAVAVGVVATVAAAGYFAKTSIDAARESIKYQRQTEAVIAATGGAANISAKQVDKLTESMSMKIGIDDEVIKKSANILLTFKQVRNEQGKGNDIFNQATAAVMDLANVFGDADSQAKMLGKALADPVKGVTALQRSGVNFTDAQKKQIESMVKSGDLLGAQKLILKEVQEQVGGTAEATATAGDKMKVAFDKVQEKVGGALIPVLEGLSTWVVSTFIPGLEKFWKDHGPQVTAVFETIRDAAKKAARWLGEEIPSAFKKITKFAKDNKAVLAGVGAALGVLVVALLAAKVAMTVMAIQTAFLNVQAWLLAANPLVGTFILIALAAAAIVGIFVVLYMKFAIVRQAAEILGGVFKAVFKAIVWAVKMNFKLIQIAIEALVSGFVWLWNHTEEMRENVVNVFMALFNGIKAAVGAGVRLILDIWGRFSGSLSGHLSGAWDAIKQIFQAGVDYFKGMIKIISGIFTGDWKKVWEGVKQVFGAIWDGILGVIKGALEYVSTLISIAGAVISGIWNTLWNGIKDVFSAIWQAIVAAVQWYLGMVGTVIRGAVGFITGVWSGLWNGLIGFVTGAFDRIVGFVGGLGQRIADGAANLWDGLTVGLKAAGNSIIRGIEVILNALIRGVNGITSTINSIPGIPFKIPQIGEAKLPRLAKGGIVNSPTIAMIGEAGPEAVIPLSGRNGMSGLASSITYNVNVNVPPTADPAKVGQAVVDSLVAWSRRNGAVPVKTAG